MITVIITDTQGGIDSTNYWGYALKIDKDATLSEAFRATLEDDESETEKEKKGIELVACSNDGNDFTIATFVGENVISKACAALESLLSAIESDARSWDVDEFKPDVPF